LCPACARIADKYPAGVLRIHGPVLQSHRAEILTLVRDEAKAEAADHPLGRIMDICDRTDEVEIAVTAMHLARRIVNALITTYGGRARFEYDLDHYFLMASWSRD
jgi:NMD protein affecting ribosome stability and mRNA decay